MRTINWGFAAVAAPRCPFQSFFCYAEKRISTTIANPSVMKFIVYRNDRLSYEFPRITEEQLIQLSTFS